jgi:hypothetical protein
MGPTQLNRLIRLVALLCATSISCAATAFAQDEFRPLTPEQRLSDPIYMSWVAYDPVSKCVSCHVSGPSDGDIDSGKSGDLTSFSRQIEMMYWLQKDKHAIARSRVEPFTESQTEDQFNKLFDRLNSQIDSAREAYTKRGVKVGPAGLSAIPEELIGDSNILSRRMCDKLWGSGSVTTPEGYAKFRDNCLTCHGGYQPGAQGFDLASLQAARLGIDCLYCHQDGKNDQWVAPHQLPEKWRMLPPETKARAGLRPLTRTAVQAELCMDCHVGNRAKNMFVTHEMYAAGHPPIPSIEVQEFCKEMPQHWQSQSDLYGSLKDFQDRDKYFAVNYPGVTDANNAGQVFWDTRNMLIGSLTARKKALDMLVDSVDSHQWADYSLYDCAACHHELESQSYRQLRGFPAAPGRPRQNEWPDAILQIAYAFAYYGDGGGLSTIKQLEHDIAAAIAEQPFGDPARVRPAADQLRGELARAIATLETKPVDGRIAKAVLTGLSRVPQERIVTYDSARQVVWAIQTIVREMEAKGATVPPQILAIVNDLNEAQTGIEVQIPSGRKTFIYPTELEADLQRRANFSPVRLKAKLDQINQLLK